MSDFIESRRPVSCPDCGASTRILYADQARQLGNWKDHDTPDGRHCRRSRKKAISSKYRGL